MADANARLTTPGRIADMERQGDRIDRLMGEQDERMALFWGKQHERRKLPLGRAVFVLREDYSDHTMWHVSSGLRSSNPENAHQHLSFRDAMAWKNALHKLGFRYRVVARLIRGRSDV